MSAASVIAVIATYRRTGELARLLASLVAIPRSLAGAVVVDNGAAAATRAVVESSGLVVEYLPQTHNLGCGGALAEGERAAFTRFGATLTHIWILDDDAVVAPDTLEHLLAALESAQAEAACPLVLDAAERIGWLPGVIDRKMFRILQRATTPEDYIARGGAEPVPFSWAQGIALLVTRRAMESVGRHRADYWVRGEDLEFSLRITHKFTGVWVPAARVHHLPPPPVGETSRAEEYRKHAAMLQNIAYTSLRLPHGRRIARTIPGNWWRFFRTWGWNFRPIVDATAAFSRGAFLGQPAGAAASVRL